MSTEVKELRINSNENSKRVMYLAKEFLVNNDVIDIVTGTAGAPIAARAAESLVRLKYITYENILTDTSIVEGRRRTKFVIRVKKTSDFTKLYEENEVNRKKAIEEREKSQTQTTQTPSK